MEELELIEILNRMSNVLESLPCFKDGLALHPFIFRIGLHDGYHVRYCREVGDNYYIYFSDRDERTIREIVPHDSQCYALANIICDRIRGLEDDAVYIASLDNMHDLAIKSRNVQDLIEPVINRNWN